MAARKIDLQDLWTVFSDSDDRVIGQPRYTVEFDLDMSAKVFR